MIITGDTESGKTSLAKTLFLDLLDHGVVPILVHGTDGPPRGAKIHDYIEQLLVNQYDTNLLETYKQTDISRRALIIDDYDRLPLSRPQKKDLLKALSSSVRYLVILSHDMTSDLEELASPGGLSGSSEDMVHYRIQPLGYVGRNKLVEQWMLLGESTDPTDGAFVRQLQHTTDTLDTLIGKNYVPSYPVYVLSVLQALDSATPIDITASTHGYFYELFIRTTLARGRNSRDFDIVASYLAFVAYHMQETGVRAISSADFRTVHGAYEEHYDIRRPFAELIRQLVDQGILIEMDDTFRFKYGYLFNYFVASYMKDHIARPDVRNMLTNVARSAHTESSANILLFLAHLSKDPVIISELLNASRHLYANYDPAELKEDIGFLADLWPALPKAVYEDRDPRANREAMLATMDRDKPLDMGLDEETVEQKSPDVDAEDPIVRFITALRHLEILGQVLKNFPGSLEASVKLDIARECFYLGLRSLSVVFEIVKTEQSEILDVMSEEIKQRNK